MVSRDNQSQTKTDLEQRLKRELPSKKISFFCQKNEKGKGWGNFIKERKSKEEVLSKLKKKDKQRIKIKELTNC